MPNTNIEDEKFVGRFEMAIMQFAILNKAQQQGGVTRENLQQVFRGELQMQKDHLDHCLDILVREEHLTKEGNKFTVTDDGREDVQKVQHLLVDLPQAIGMRGGGGAAQRPEPQQTAGGGGTTGSTIGQQGDMGRSSPQGGSVGAQQGETQPGNISGKSGVSGQRNTADVSKGGATQPAGEKGDR